MSFSASHMIRSPAVPMPSFCGVDHKPSWRSFGGGDGGTLDLISQDRGDGVGWSGGLMRWDNQLARVGNELVIETVRAAHFPERISRLKGMFCFLDLESAERGCSWATGPYSHFRP